MKLLNKLGDALLGRLAPETSASAAPCPCTSACHFCWSKGMMCYSADGCTIAKCYPSSAC